jgi:hypothetical protein
MTKNKRDFSMGGRSLLGLDTPSAALPIAPENKTVKPPTAQAQTTDSEKLTSPPQSVGTADGILGDIPPQKRLGKDITVYLSTDVLTAIEQVATSRGVSKSRVVDKCLRQVFKIQ